MVWQSQRRTFSLASGEGPLVLAHRGASTLETENTLAAFRRAMAEGADGVELDVQRCATGEVVVFHDDDLSSAGGQTRANRAAFPGCASPGAAAALGARFRPWPKLWTPAGPHRAGQHRDQAFGALSGGCRALVAAWPRSWRVRMRGPGFSFRRSVRARVWWWRKIRPDVPSGLLFERPRPFHCPWPLRSDSLLPVLRPFAVHPEHTLCTRDSVARWQARGFAVNVWTVDAPERMTALAAMGVSAIITNDPAGARSALTLTRRSAGG
jgi:glycerophosphoryl diester phosphodiesterase